MKVLRDIIQQLSSVYSPGEASALSRWVLEERFLLSLTDLMLGKDSELSADEQQELRNIVQRLLRKEPVQYVLGRTTFCGLSLHVRPGALIPRSETQELVAWICEENKGADNRKILDIGTGSGCIALALANAGFRVEAWDVSPEALAIARENAAALNLPVEFRERDILQPETIETADRFDLIVSNPPYICEHEAEEMDDNVLAHEPRLALFVPDDDPLRFYRVIARFALQALLPGGQLFFEINRAYGQETLQMLQSLGFTNVELRKDQFGNDRMTRAVLS